jgi:hypothetical protein
MYSERRDAETEISASGRSREKQLQRQRKKAIDVLVEVRERLVAQLCDQVLAGRELLLDSSSEGVFSFEFQEIEDRYSGRLHAINSILENLEYRRPRLAHRVETMYTSPDHLARDLNDLVDRFDQWDLVDIDVTPLESGELLAVVSFTADEYLDE